MGNENLHPIAVVAVSRTYLRILVYVGGRVTVGRRHRICALQWVPPVCLGAGLSLFQLICAHQQCITEP
jgi:hypothetical protein